MSSHTIPRTKRFNFITTGFDGLYLVERNQINDERGYFERAFCNDEFVNFGATSIAQINRSFTKTPGIIRGMHFQNEPHAEQKIVTCVTGKIFDVVIDLRKSSATYLQWYGIELTSEKPLSLLVPIGFAHGFQSMTENCLIEYFVQTAFTPTAEDGINAFDPAVNIAWPLHCSGISEKDSQIPFLRDVD